MKKRYLVTILAVAFTLLLLSACSDDSSSASDQPDENDQEDVIDDNRHADNNADAAANQDESDSKDVHGSPDSEQNDPSSDTDQTNTVNGNNSENASSNDKFTKGDHDNAKITRMAEAIDHLKTKLDENDEVNMSDTEFIPDDRSPKTDKKGKYYIISLVSKSMREEGGSGTVGKYNVYQNGDYEMAY
ncbi:hypothetical protein GCM10028778_16600 [Barrientosiimonas marina]|uniref:Lipoprotein n=1 Tax=Lentibacillus kimchii TaxID=1542911 RepID=A0ABW2UTU1_9BACI